MEHLVLEYLNKQQKQFTKVMYRALKCKELGLSLNGFRKLLYTMSTDNLIKFNAETETSLPYWSLR